MRDRPGEQISAPAALRALSAIVAGDKSQHAVLRRTCEATQAVISGAAAVSVTVLERKQPRTAAATDDLALRADEAQYQTHGGPCLEAVRQAAIVTVPDMRREARWPAYVERAAALGVAGSMSIPLPVEEGAIGALNIYATEPDAFDDAAVRLAVDLAQYAGVVATNADMYTRATTLAEQMEQAMESRAVIEQAKGVLMGRQHCSADDAFALLVKLSQDTHRKLRDVAEAVVEQARKG